MTPANDNWPIVLTRKEAASMCGLSPSGFDSWVRRGLVPPAMEGTRRWSRDAIKKAIAAGGIRIDVELDPYEQWKVKNAGKA